MAINELSPPHIDKDLTELTRLLQSLCDDEEAVTTALRQIQEEVDLLMLDASMKLGGARHELKDLIQAFEKVSRRLSFEQLLALQAFCTAWGKPVGKANSLIYEMSTAATKALDSLEINAPDYRRHLFAARIADILKNTLNIMPALTRDDPDIINGKQGGAAYARVLRESLKLAEIEPGNDLRRLMRQGLQLLNGDLRGDHYEAEETGDIAP